MLFYIGFIYISYNSYSFNRIAFSEDNVLLNVCDKQLL